MIGRLGRALGTLLTIAFVVAWFVLLRPASLGGTNTWVVIRGSSMLPTYQTGDLVIVRTASDFAAGDVAAYRVPAGEIGEGQVVIHRVTGGNASTGFELQGDNNDAVDPWMPTQSDMVGRAWLAIPGLGRVIAFIHDPVVLAGLVTSFVVAWIIARPSRPRGADPSPAPLLPDRVRRPQPVGMRTLRPRSAVA